MPGTLFVVATPIGNLEDITVRALRVLREVSVIAAEDTRRTAHLLTRYAITTPTTSLHEHNEVKKAPSLVARLKSGTNVALVSDAGTPTVSDPGGYLIRAALSAGIRIEPVPGPSAALAALCASGMPTDTFLFLGFPPIQSNNRVSWFESVRSAGRTVIFFEAPHRIRRTLQDLLATVGDCEVVLARELTKAHEELVKKPISELMGALESPRGEFTVVVNIGQMIDSVKNLAASDADMALEFGDMTNKGGLGRRQAIGILAKRHGRAPNDVYAAIERGRKLVK